MCAAIASSVNKSATEDIPQSHVQIGLRPARESNLAPCRLRSIYGNLSDKRVRFQGHGLPLCCATVILKHHSALRRGLHVSAPRSAPSSSSRREEKAIHCNAMARRGNETTTTHLATLRSQNLDSATLSHKPNEAYLVCRSDRRSATSEQVDRYNIELSGVRCTALWSWQIVPNEKRSPRSTDKTAESQ